MNTIRLFKMIDNQRQIDLEVTMVMEGYERTFQSIDDGNESFMSPVLRFVNDLTTDFSQKIKDSLKTDEQDEEKRTRRSKLEMSLQYIDVSHLSYLTCRTMINTMCERRKRNSLGKQMSGIILRNIEFNIKASKKLTQEKKTALLAKTDSYKIVGYHLLTLFIDSYPEHIKVSSIHTDKTIRRGHSPEFNIEPTEAWTEKMADNMEVFAFTNHSNKPMIRPPKPWNNSGYNGGYYSRELKVPIHKVHANKSKEDTAHSVASPDVIKAVNSIQSTPWRVNVDVLDVLVKLEQDMPTTLKDVFPPQPKILEKKEIQWMDKEDFLKLPDEEKKILRNHQDKVNHTRDRISAKKSVDISTISAIRQAKEYMNERSIYFPYSIDYRGRIYSLAMSGLNPQGSDLSKGLLQFARGRKISTGRGVKWYKVNLANLIGYDKETIDNKVMIVENMEKELREIASDPIKNDQWHSWDKPVQGLGACLEYVKWLDDPDMLVHTHVQLDGTCNGIQHLTALSRDSAIAPHVGLIPTKEKGDIYQYVCDGVDEEIDRIIRAGKAHEHFGVANEWKTSGLINRKLTKKPVKIMAVL